MTLDLSTARDRSNRHNLWPVTMLGMGTLASSLRSGAHAEVLDGEVNQLSHAGVPGRQMVLDERDLPQIAVWSV